MKTVGLKTLKNRLGEYVRLAASGERVVVTDRGRPVAEIVPPRAEPESRDRARHPRGLGQARHARSGWPPKLQPIEGYTLEQLLADLHEDRKDPWC